MTAGSSLDPNEWDLNLGKLLRYHFNISEEIRLLIAQIKKEMNQDLVPVAEDKATYGKTVKSVVRSMWALEYEIADLQEAFAKEMGSIDIENLTDDFIEEMLLQSKPLQGVLHAIRERQKIKLAEVIKEYGDKIKDLEPMIVPRPPKPEPKPAEPEKKPEEKKPEGEEGEKKPEEGEKKPEEEGEKKPEEEGEKKPDEVVAEPEPAIDPASAAPAAVEASA